MHMWDEYMKRVSQYAAGFYTTKERAIVHETHNAISK